MNMKSTYYPVEEYKIKASILLKQWRSPQMMVALPIAQRLQILPHLTHKTPQAIYAQKEQIKRKHILQLIALEQGFASWPALKQAASQSDSSDNLTMKQRDALLHPSRCAAFLNDWFAHYPDARAHLEANGGYLLPYRHQFFICQAQYIETMGLAADDPDWQLIDYDWVRPADSDASQRLYTRLINNRNQ